MPSPAPKASPFQPTKTGFDFKANLDVSMDSPTQHHQQRRSFGKITTLDNLRNQP